MKATIGPERLDELNTGSAQARTLVEALAIDQATLMSHVVPDASDSVHLGVAGAAGMGILKKMNLIGELLRENFGAAGYECFARHESDTVRGWACFMIGADGAASVIEMIRAIRPLADDAHFTVREWAWMGVRKALVEDLDTSIDELRSWTDDPSERIRRFASESLRPRGVWAEHIAELKQNPERGRALLEPLRADSAVYVQDSVANWINDASKTQPQWAVELCRRWAEESPVPPTHRIVKRALRSLKSTPAEKPATR